MNTDKPTHAVRQWSLIIPLIVAATGICWTSFYVNLSYRVKPDEGVRYRFFPPFREYCNRNMNDHLGAENLSIAKSIYAGNGFASPFHDATGPTAWMPPILPAILAALLWVHEGDIDSVTNTVIAIQLATLLLATWVLLLITRQTTWHISPWAALALVAVAFCSQFFITFQMTHDCWLNLLTLTAILSGFWFARPLRSIGTVVGWGAFGGLAALVGPILGLTWAVLTMVEGIREKQLRRVALAGVVSMLAITPWTIRNYVVFNRFIPVKSNVAFELHQSQCLEPDGVLRFARIPPHPHASDNAERKAYKQMGEMAYLDSKMETFKAAVIADPASYLRKAGNRFLAATLVYMPMDEASEETLYWGLWMSRVTHAIPFLAAVFLVVTSFVMPLRRAQLFGLIAYCVYLGPYILVSYYDRYGFPTLLLKMLLVVWAADRIMSLCATVATPTEPVTASVPEPSSTTGLHWHRWLAGFALAGVFVWWYGSIYVDKAIHPVVERYGTSVVVPDLFQEWYSARLWWENRPVYAPTEIGARQHLQIGADVQSGLPQRNAHPPGAVLIALPLGALSFDEAFALWSILSLWCAAFSAYVIVRTLRIAVPGWSVLPIVTAVLASSPFWAQLVHGQLNLVLLPFLVGAWAANRTQQQGLAGVLVATAGLVKLFPFYLLLYFALTGRWKAVATGLGTTVAGVVVSSAILGRDVWPTYFFDVLPVTKEFSAVWANTSLTGLWLKLFEPSNLWPTVVMTPITADRQLALFGAGLTTLSVTAILFQSSKRFQGGVQPDDGGFAAAITAMLLVSPVVWEHYFLLLALPIVVLLREPFGTWRSFATAAALFILAVSRHHLVLIGMNLVGVASEHNGSWPSPPWLTASVVSAQTWALVGLFVLLVTAPAQSTYPQNSAKTSADA